MDSKAVKFAKYVFNLFYGIYTWRRIEVVVTRTTRNRFVGDEPARGFESHRLRQQRDAAPRTRTSPLWSARIFMPALVPGIYFASVPHRKPHSVVLGAVFLLPI